MNHDVDCLDGLPSGSPKAAAWMSNFQQVSKDLTPKVVSLYEIQKSLNVVARATRSMILVSEPAEVQKEAARINEARKTSATA